jgi:ABC-type branched-subunit amino acid transport system substrate-binding protein
VALLLPLSGPAEALGRSFLDAATLALFEVGGDRLVLMPRDTQGTAEFARAAAESALQEGAELILGPVFSPAVAAAADAARARRVSMVAFSTDTTIAGDGVFLLSFLQQQQVDRVVRYATLQGHRRYAALAPETPYGIAVVESLRVSADDTGGALVNIQLYAAVEPDMMGTVERLADYELRRNRLAAERRSLVAQGDQAGLARLEGLDTLGSPGFDAVMLAASGSELRQLAPLLPFFDVDPDDVQFVGTGLWDDPTLGQEPALVGAWFAAPPPQAAARFLERFTSVWGYRPLRISTLAYDAVALVAALSRGTVLDFTRAAIANPHGFAGTDGIFRFLSSGVVDRGLAVMEVEADGLAVIDPAPSMFQQVIN